jgi:DNA-binding response OmpR family regulator
MAKRILVVDDDENILSLERTILEQKGFDVTAAAGGAEALKLLAGQVFDLVLLDVMMPEVDGFEMLRRMQERHGLGSVPVIMFSGKVDEETASRAAREGANAFMGKPFDPQALIESTKQLLRRR